MDTSREKLDTFGEKLDTFGEKVNTCRPSVDTWAGSGEQVFTPAPVCALSGTPLRAPPDRPPSPRAALPFVLNKCTIEPAIPTSYPSCPAPPAHPPSRLPLLTSPGMPPAVSPSHSGSSDKLADGPCGGVRPVRGSVSQPVLPVPPARARVTGPPQNPLQTVSRQPDPLWGSGWRETVPPFTPTNSPATPRLVGRPSRRFEQAGSASETPGRMISAGFAGGH